MEIKHVTHPEDNYALRHNHLLEGFDTRRHQILQNYGLRRASFRQELVLGPRTAIRNMQRFLRYQFLSDMATIGVFNGIWLSRMLS